MTARALDPIFYTDPDAYQSELVKIFAKTWQYAGHVSRLANVGDYFCFEVAGDTLFCIRDDENEIRAFYNVCQHRAHELLKGAGNCKRLVCPYHAWTYDLDGKFRSGPNTSSVPNFDGSSIRLKDVQVDVFNGFIFVNLDPDAKSMDEWYPKARAELAAFVPQIHELEPLLTHEVSEVCNWKVSVENYSECYHCRLNHPTFATGVIKASTYNILPQGHCLRHTTESQNLEKMSYPIDIEANEFAGSYSSWFLYPNFSFQVYPGNTLNTYHWIPRGVDGVDVRRGWYTVGGEDSDVIRGLAQQDLDTTVAEDIRLVESVQRGLESRGYSAGPLVIDPKTGVESEHSILALQGWIRDALGS